MNTVSRTDGLTHTSRLALQAERQETTALTGQVPKPVFWDKWSKLSTGQKWGRALAWLVPPLGIGLHAGAQLWQTKQAKLAMTRPQESLVRLSQESTNGIAARSQTTFGAADRLGAKTLLKENLDRPETLVSAGDALANSAAMVGLPTQFAKDIVRSQNHLLESAQGHAAVAIKGNSQDPAATFRGFFQAEFAGDPQRADQWAKFAAKFMNQVPSITLNTQAQEASGLRLTSKEQNHACSLKMEPGGTSALVQVRTVGTINNVYANDGQAVAAERDFDSKQSRMEETGLLRIKLGPPEDFEFIACQNSHQFKAFSEPVDDMMPIERGVAEDPNLLSGNSVRRLLSFMKEDAIGDREKPDVDRLKQEVLSGARELTAEQRAIFDQYFEQNP